MGALCAYLGISNATGWRRVQDDPSFPEPIKVSDGVTLFDLRDADLYVALEEGSARRSERASKRLMGSPPMRRLNPPPSPELIACQALDHAEIIGCDYKTAYGLDAPWDDDASAQITSYHSLTRYPMQVRTRSATSIHEAGHCIAFENLGMVALQAEIYAPLFEDAGWTGAASSLNYAGCGQTPRHWEPNEFRRGAVSALAGPVAEELLGDGDAISNVGELIAAAIYARRAEQLEGRDGRRAARKSLVTAISLVELHEPAIRDIADLLERERHISRDDLQVRTILARIPQEPIDARQLSTRRRAVFGGQDHERL